MKGWKFSRQWFGSEGRLQHQGMTAHLRHITGAYISTFSVTEEGHVICEGTRSSLLSCLKQAELHILAPVQQSLAM